MAASDDSERRRPQSAVRRIASQLALACAGVILAFIIAEVGVRVTGLAKPSFYTYDPYRGWALIPGAEGWQRDEGVAYVKMNREGFRGPEYSRTKPPGTLRIAVLGDSYTEAQQVPFPQTFCSVVQRELAERLVGSNALGMHVKRVEVMDFGCDSYGTAQELMTLRHQAWQYSPDIVVLAFFPGNDLRNNSVVMEGDKCRPFYVYRGGKLVLGGPFWDSRIFRMECMIRFESRHLRILTLMGEARDVIREWMRHRLQTNARPKPSKPIGSEPGLNDLIYRAPSTPVWRDAWRVTEGEIEMMHREVAARGKMFLVVTLTNGIQVDPNHAHREKYMHWLGVSSLFYPGLRIKALGKRDGFAALDLAPLLQAYADQHDVYLHGFKNTHMGIGHWNATGHHIAGKLIAAKLYQMIEQHSLALHPKPDALHKPT